MWIAFIVLNISQNVNLMAASTFIVLETTLRVTVAFEKAIIIDL